MNSDQTNGYSECASSSDNSCNEESMMIVNNDNEENIKQVDKTMQRFTDLMDIQMSNPDKSLVNGKWNMNVRGLEVQSEDTSLKVVFNPGSQLANINAEINAEKALTTEQTETAERMDLDQQESKGYECDRERNVNDQLGIKNGCECTEFSHGCKSNYDQDRLAVRATFPRAISGQLHRRNELA